MHTFEETFGHYYGNVSIHLFIQSGSFYTRNFFVNFTVKPVITTLTQKNLTFNTVKLIRRGWTGSVCVNI